MFIVRVKLEVGDVNFYVIVPNIIGSEKFEIMNGENEVVFEMDVSELGG